MASRKKFKQPFDSRGGALVMGRHLLKSEQYLSLMPQAKVLMMLMQLHWTRDKPVDYGVREAMEKIPCSKRTAMKAFNQLEECGFIYCVEYAWFSSRTESRSRSWRLEWMPFNDQKPRNTWENIKTTGAKTTPVNASQVQKRHLGS